MTKPRPKKRLLIRAVDVIPAVYFTVGGVSGHVTYCKDTACKECGNPGVAFVVAACVNCGSYFSRTHCGYSYITERDGVLRIDVEAFVCDRCTHTIARQIQNMV